MRWPVDKLIITQGYSAAHPANDLAGPMLTPIFAPENAAVVGLNNDAGAYFGGKYVILQGDSGLRHYLGHNSNNRVNLGQRVGEGQHIADMGMTGFAIPSQGISAPSGPHTHHQVERNGQTLDFKNIIGGTTVPGVDPGGLGDFEVNAMSLGFFGYTASQEFLNQWRGKDPKTFMRWCFANSAFIDRETMTNNAVSEASSLKAQVKQLQDQLASGVGGGGNGNATPAERAFLDGMYNIVSKK